MAEVSTRDYRKVWPRARVLCKGCALGPPDSGPYSHVVPNSFPDCFVGRWRVFESQPGHYVRAVVCDRFADGCCFCSAYGFKEVRAVVASHNSLARSGAR